MLEHYERAMPGTGGLILEQFQKESEHRQSLEVKMLDAEIEHQQADAKNVGRGQWFAFAIALVALLAAAACILCAKVDSQAYAGAGIAGTSLVGLVGTFIYGKKTPPPAQNKPEEEGKGNNQLAS